MTIIVIKDLPESVDLDRQAMAAIAGGARTGSRQIFAGGTIFRSTRIVNYPAGFGSKSLAAANSQATGSAARK